MVKEKERPTEEKKEKPKIGVPEQRRGSGKPEKKERAGLIGKEIAAAERLIRILQTDIPGNKRLYASLTRIKGVSWAIANAVCVLNNLDKNKRIEELTKEEINKIENVLKTANFPGFLANRRKEFASGRDRHLLGSDLDLAEEFDIKRLKKIRSYRGLRHAMGQPTRGQRTRSHFRTQRKRGVGIKFKKSAARMSGGSSDKGG